MHRSIREIKQNEIDFIINYFIQSEHAFLIGMGVDPDKLPKYHDWRQLILNDWLNALENRQFYYLLWLINNQPVGHSNINKIVYGDHAYMHLHLWDHGDRQMGNGTHFIKACIRNYFETFDLSDIFCEPYAFNPAPNKILARTGFQFVKQYETTPGWINFHQMVNRWSLSREKWLRIEERNGL